MSIAEIAAKARFGSIRLAAVKTDVKNKALAQIADALKRRSAEIIAANEKDLAVAKENNLAGPCSNDLALGRTK